MAKQLDKFFKFGFREVASLARRLGEKLKDKYFWTHKEIEESIGYLIYFRDLLKKQPEKKKIYHEIFGESGEFFQIHRFKKGFNMRSITFKTIVGTQVKKWVMKVGHRISVVVDFGDPSTENYYKEHVKNLQLLQKKIKKYPELTNLLPSPHEIAWAVLDEEGYTSASTLILQPFVTVVVPTKIKKRLTEDQRKNLLKEFSAFKKLCNELFEEHNLQPDLLGEGNLEIVEKDGEYHLMLLDTGFVNMEAPLPFTTTVIQLASLNTLANVEKLIRRVL